MSENLADKQCAPCRAGQAPLEEAALANLERALGNGWGVIDEHHLEKTFKFSNFREALDFTNQVGELAERQNHHPDIYLSWGQVKLTIWTHKVGGLTENDFILAAKIDANQSVPSTALNAEAV